jgi:hypothetical protein
LTVFSLSLSLSLRHYDDVHTLPHKVVPLGNL